MTATPGQSLTLPVTQKREFWVLMAYAVVLGVFGAFAALIFVGAITLGGKWYRDSHPGWLGGHWWWVAVAAAAGIAVGLVRRVTRLPWQTPDPSTPEPSPGRGWLRRSATPQRRPRSRAPALCRRAGFAGR